MKKIRLIPAVNDAEIFGIASLAEEIWNEYFPSSSANHKLTTC